MFTSHAGVHIVQIKSISIRYLETKTTDCKSRRQCHGVDIALVYNVNVMSGNFVKNR